MTVKKFEGVVQIRWHHWNPGSPTAIYDLEIDGKLPENGGSLYGLPFEKMGFKGLHGARYKVKIEEIDPGEEIKNPWHQKCADCGEFKNGHERNCCPTKGASRYGHKYICNDCWGKHGLEHYAKRHPSKLEEQRELTKKYG